MGGYYYITSQGDMWDYIAWKVYGDEYRTDILYEANPEHILTYIFSAGTQIWCPYLSGDEEEEETASWRDDEEEDEDAY